MVAFQFNPQLFAGKARQKYLDAQKRITQLHKKYPEVKKADEYLNYLKKEYNYLKVGLFNQQRDINLEELKTEINDLEKHYLQLLDRYKIPHDYKEPDWDCPLCQDQGKIYKDGSYLICSCAVEQELARQQKKGNLPAHLTGSTFAAARLDYYDDHLKTEKGMTYRENAQKIYSLAQSFSKGYSTHSSGRGLIIEGPVGSGKSFLLGCIANSLIKRRIGFKYLVYTDLLQEIRSTYNRDNLDEKELIEEVQRAPVLLIDDLGTEKASEFAATILYQIIDNRYREERPIILTTNHPLSELKERFDVMGERIFQRVLEMNRYVELYGNVRARIIAEKQEVNF